MCIISLRNDLSKRKSLSAGLSAAFSSGVPPTKAKANATNVPLQRDRCAPIGRRDTTQMLIIWLPCSLPTTHVIIRPTQAALCQRKAAREQDAESLLLSFGRATRADDWFRASGLR